MEAADPARGEGQPEAQALLGHMLAHGEGGPTDLREARRHSNPSL